MRKRRRRQAPTRYPTQYRDRYDDHYYPAHRRSSSPIQRFFVTILWVLSIIVLFCLLLLIAFNFALFIEILLYALFIGAGLAILGILYVAVRLLTAISLRLSEARRASALAKQEHVRIQREQESIHLAQSKRTREEYTFYQRRAAPEPGRESPYRTRKLSPLPDEADTSDDLLETELQAEPQVPGMPLPGQIFRYADYGKLMKPGQLIIGIRRDGTARLGTWQDFKVLLILGSSSSGKTTTLVEKALGAARGGGHLVVCDPHGHKPDSLLRKIYSLQNALMPGTVFAIEHTDIMHNVEAVKRELDKRVQGSPCTIPIFLIIEELNRLQRDKAIAAELKEILQILGQEGRGFNMFAIIGAQQITHLAEIRKSIISFAIHRVDESESRLCIPARFAKYSMELSVGQTFVKDADGITEPLQQVLVTVQDVQRLAQALQTRRHPSPATHTLTAPVSSQRATVPLQPVQESPVPIRRTRPAQSPLPGVPATRQPAAGAIWGEEPEKLVLPSAQRDTDDLSQVQTLGDIILQSQASIAQNKLDLLTEARARKKKR